MFSIDSSRKAYKGKIVLKSHKFIKELIYREIIRSHKDFFV